MSMPRTQGVFKVVGCTKCMQFYAIPSSYQKRICFRCQELITMKGKKVYYEGNHKTARIVANTLTLAVNNHKESQDRLDKAGIQWR